MIQQFVKLVMFTFCKIKDQWCWDFSTGVWTLNPQMSYNEICMDDISNVKVWYLTFLNPLKGDTLHLAHIVRADASDHIWCRFKVFEERYHSGFVYHFLHTSPKFVLIFCLNSRVICARVILHDVFTVRPLFLRVKPPRCLAAYLFWFRFSNLNFF